MALNPSDVYFTAHFQPMKNVFIVCSMMIMLHQQVAGQENKFARETFRYRNSLQLEAFGPGAYYSLNYERNLINLPRMKTSFQIGGAYYPPATGVITLLFPVRLNQLYSFGRHHLESGIGVIFTFSDTDNGATPLRDYDFETFLTASLGYRYQKPDGRWLLKVLFTPVLEYENRRELTPTGSLTLGFNF